MHDLSVSLLMNKFQGKIPTKKTINLMYHVINNTFISMRY